MSKRTEIIEMCNIVFVIALKYNSIIGRMLHIRLKLSMIFVCKQCQHKDCWNTVSNNHKSYCCYCCLSICLSGCLRGWLAHWLLSWLMCWLAVWLVASLKWLVNNLALPANLNWLLGWLASPPSLKWFQEWKMAFSTAGSADAFLDPCSSVH